MSGNLWKQFSGSFTQQFLSKTTRPRLHQAKATQPIPSDSNLYGLRARNMPGFLRAIVLLLALLNPFLVIVILLDVVRTVDVSTFRRVLFRAALIAGAVFSSFAVAGDAIFSGIIQAEFASFQIFGGVMILLKSLPDYVQTKNGGLIQR